MFCFQAQEDNALLEGIVHCRYQLTDGSSSSADSGSFISDNLTMLHTPPCISQVVEGDAIIQAAVQQAEMCAFVFKTKSCCVVNTKSIVC